MKQNGVDHQRNYKLSEQAGAKCGHLGDLSQTKEEDNEEPIGELGCDNHHNFPVVIG